MSSSILFNILTLLTSSVSRRGLYDSDESDHVSDHESDHKSGYMPNMEFEFVEVDEINNEETNNEEEEEEFDFPLFASAKAATEVNETPEEERGRSTTKTMKVSLREESVEVIKNERPDSYYFADYTEQERANFKAAAQTPEEIHKSALPYPDPKPWQHIDVQQHNLRIDEEKKKKKTKRAGKKKRDEAIQSRIRKDEREKLMKKLAREQRAKLKKMRWAREKPVRTVYEKPVRVQNERSERRKVVSRAVSNSATNLNDL